MAGVNEAIAREYFESLGFLVRQPHKYMVIARAKRPEEEIDFIAVNPAPRADIAPPTGARLVNGAELRGVERAVVSVRGWHTDRVSPSLLNVAPGLVRFAQEPALRRARADLGPGPLTRILCLSALPASAALRRKALDLLAEKGVDGVLLFPTMLRELIRAIEANKNYEKSDLLQILRILKNYDLLRDEQLELFRRARRRPRAARDAAT
jgi:hypothetical protein